ncbi:hypothetical protein HZ326_26246, partial [Fusarium oxysporum f. sp. albedinis]
CSQQNRFLWVNWCT